MLESVDGEWNVMTDTAVAEKDRDPGMIRKVVTCAFWHLLGPAASTTAWWRKFGAKRNYILQPCFISIRLHFDDTMVGGNGLLEESDETPEISASLHWSHIGLHLVKDSIPTSD